MRRLGRHTRDRSTDGPRKVVGLCHHPGCEHQWSWIRVGVGKFCSSHGAQHYLADHNGSYEVSRVSAQPVAPNPYTNERPVNYGI